MLCGDVRTRLLAGMIPCLIKRFPLPWKIDEEGWTSGPMTHDEAHYVAKCMTHKTAQALIDIADACSAGLDIMTTLQSLDAETVRELFREVLSRNYIVHKVPWQVQSSDVHQVLASDETLIARYGSEELASLLCRMAAESYARLEEFGNGFEAAIQSDDPDALHRFLEEDSKRREDVFADL